MADAKSGATSTEDGPSSRNLDSEREQALSGFVKLAEQAYQQKLVTMESGPEEIVYTVRIPHETSGPGLELFALANSQAF